MASDNFNRANGGLGSSWTDQQSTQAITSNAAFGGNAAGYASSFYNAAPFSNDQTSQVKIVSSFNYVAAAVRMSGTAGATNWYAFFSHGVLQKMVAGVVGADLGTSAAAAVGDTIKLTVVGTTLTCYINGVSVISVTDTSFASGSPGIAWYQTAAGADEVGWRPRTRGREPPPR